MAPTENDYEKYEIYLVHPLDVYWEFKESNFLEQNIFPSQHISTIKRYGIPSSLNGIQAGLHDYHCKDNTREANATLVQQAGIRVHRIIGSQICDDNLYQRIAGCHQKEYMEVTHWAQHAL